MNSLDDGAAPRTVVVTGASGGIGRAIAVAFAGLGWPVALGARRASELEQTAELVAAAGGKPFAQTLDVRDVESINRFLSATSEQFGGVDVLVNNAGVAVPGAVHELADDDHRAILETNLLGPMLLTKRVVQDLRRAGRPGDVVFISSDATVHVRPHMATYLSSKAGLEAFATTLALECEGTSIRSSIVRVGPTLTGFGDGWDPELFADLFPYWQRFGIQRHFNTMQPDDVARAVVSVATAPRHMWVPIIEVQPQPPVT